MRERDTFVDGPTIFRHRAVSPLEDQVHPPAAVLDQLDGPGVLHVLCAFPVDLQDLVAHLHAPETSRIAEG